MATLNAKITDLLEKNRWHVYHEQHEKKHFAECETWSPAGEDLVVTIWYDGTGRDFIKNFREYADDFDPDEHAEIWANSRGRNGVPNSIRELIDDADAIKEMLDDMATQLEALLA